MSTTTRLIFYVNGAKVEDDHVDPTTTLASYLRNKLKLTGTKIGCNEGGCGACTVMLSEITQDATIKHYSVNACLTLICSVHGKAVTTVEGIGSVRSKLHPVQERLSNTHGSQCGFCTPGFIMAMYALLRNNPKPSKYEIDEALQGNLCRCTGYRPILESFYSFAQDFMCCGQSGTENAGVLDATKNSGCCMGNSANGGECCKDKVNNVCNGIEEKTDANMVQLYDSTQDPLFPADLKLNRYDLEYLKVEHPNCTWYRPLTLDQLLELKEKHNDGKIVAGNTEVGIEMKFKNFAYPVLINPLAIPELKQCYTTDDGLFVGAAVSLNEMNLALKGAIEKFEGDRCKFFVEYVKMLHWFAGKHIRNVACAVGNLMTASPISDLNPLFMASGSVAIVDSVSNGRRKVLIDDTFFTGYRKTCLNLNDVVAGIVIPFSDKNEYFAGFKQAQRREDDIAIVNAGICVKFKLDTNVVENIRLCFGGMAPTTVMAKKTAKEIIGKRWTNELLEDVMGKALLSDLSLPPGVPGGMEKYRQTLCLSFFFKFINKIAHERFINENGRMYNSSIVNDVQYSPMKATQIYQGVKADQNQNDCVGRPLAHLSADRHTTGEAVYCDDVQIANALYASFVTSRKGHANILKVDANEALRVPGVVAYIDHTDVPDIGTNIYAVGQGNNDQKIFANDKVTSFGQIIGMIVADDNETARKACQLVKVEYEQLPTIVTLEEAIKANTKYNFDWTLDIENGECGQSMFESIDGFVEGEVRIGGQEHFYLETQACIVIPREDQEVEVISSTQDVTDMQHVLSHVLGIAAHKIVVRVKRIGGGFGGKETCSILVALPCAIAAMKLRRPVRCALERFDDMIIKGGRHPFIGKYKIGYNKDLRINAYQVEYLSNAGYCIDLSHDVMAKAVSHADNAYNIPNVKVSGSIYKTNIPSSTAFRGFGSPQAMFIIEHCISDVAYALGATPEQVREKNLYHEGDVTYYKQVLNKCNIRRCWDECIEMSSFHEVRAEIDEFNKNNRWKKRGVALIPSKFGVSFGVKCMMQSGALVHIYRDGSVLISHGGMEMGQGLHTKMAQVATRVLGVPMESIYINDTSTDKVPNTIPTAASLGSDLNGLAVKDACEILMNRLQPVFKANPDKPWSEICDIAYREQINLSASGHGKVANEVYDWKTKTNDSFVYFTYGAGCTQVEIDCLTGDHRMLRTDIVMDIGESLNPALDIGQIEGAFIQGYGLYTFEEIKCSPTGIVYTRGPGTYKIPSADDVPREFHVKLLKGSSNPSAIFSSKAVGEPPLFLGVTAFFAIKDAIKSARENFNLHGPFRLDSPATPERIRLACEDHLTTSVPSPVPGTYEPWTVQL